MPYYPTRYTLQVNFCTNVRPKLLGECCTPVYCFNPATVNIPLDALYDFFIEQPEAPPYPVFADSS